MATRLSWRPKCSIGAFGCSWSSRRGLAVPLSLAGVLLLAGCGAGSLEPYQRFAVAGAAFSDTVPAVVKESFALSVRNDSQQLRDFRTSNSDPAARLQHLETSEEDMQTRIAVLRDFNQHSRLLKAYFMALGDLAQSGIGQDVGTSAAGLVNSLTTVSDRLKANLESTNVLGKPIGELIPAAATVAVRGVQAAALRSELERNGAVIERELALMEGFLTGLQEIARMDFDSLQETHKRDAIDLPFQAAAPLPAGWDQQRETFFMAQLILPAIDKAAEASANLRRSFIALMEGTLSEGHAAALVADVAEIVALFERKPA